MNEKIQLIKTESLMIDDFVCENYIQVNLWVDKYANEEL